MTKQLCKEIITTYKTSLLALAGLELLHSLLLLATAWQFSGLVANVYQHAFTDFPAAAPVLLALFLMLCLQLLAREGIRVVSRIAEIGGICDVGELAESTEGKRFPVVNDDAGDRMIAAIMEAKAAGDSLGGVVECRVLGLPVGLGGPLFDGLESRIAALVFGIPAVKGLDFGAGFEAARLRGSENNDPFVLRQGRVVTGSNRCGGILGGMSDGMPLVFHVAFKPTPSIALPQRSVDLERMEETELRIGGRHDPCVVPRAVPVVEAAAAIAVCDALLEGRKDRSPWN